jgi:hypothetical protein
MWQFRTIFIIREDARSSKQFSRSAQNPALLFLEEEDAM